MRNPCPTAVSLIILKSIHPHPLSSLSNNPSEVQKHLGKLFDSMDALKFQMKGDKPTKVATHMVAKDKEVVEFPKLCNLDGESEIYIYVE